MDSIHKYCASLHSDRRRLRANSKHSIDIYAAITEYLKVGNLNVLCLFSFPIIGKEDMSMKKIFKILFGYLWRVLGLLIFVLDILVLGYEIINPKSWINK